MTTPRPPVPSHQIRTVYDDKVITVYQAYPARIAAPASEAGTFVDPFKRSRMTWIKPSFLWMMYRCGWATKPGQETVLTVEITRDGFERALRQACLSSCARGVHPDRATWQRQLKRAPTRVQWGPERDLCLRHLPYRSLQLGLSGEAARCYADEWTVAVHDVTSLAHEIHAPVSSGDPASAARLLPQERPYPVGDELLAHLRG